MKDKYVIEFVENVRAVNDFKAAAHVEDCWRILHTVGHVVTGQMIILTGLRAHIVKEEDPSIYFVRFIDETTGEEVEEALGKSSAAPTLLWSKCKCTSLMEDYMMDLIKIQSEKYREKKARMIAKSKGE